MPMMLLSGHMMPVVINEKEVQYNYFGHVTPLAPTLASRDADSVVNGTIAFLRSKQLK